MQTDSLHAPERRRESVIACMDAAEDALLARADQAVSSASQNRYFEVLGDLRNQRRALIDTFMVRWDTAATPAAPAAETSSDPTVRAFALLEEICAALGERGAQLLDARFRAVIARSLAERALRPEGRVALLKAIESRCLVPVGEHSPERAPREAAAGDAEKFTGAWNRLLEDAGLPAPAQDVLQRLRPAFATLWELAPDWFAVTGAGLQLLADLLELLPGIECGTPPYLPMVERTIGTLVQHPERFPGVWLEWRFERFRRARLQQEWLGSAQFDARHAVAVRAAGHQVREVCAQRMAGRRFPEPVLSLVGVGWSEVLMLGFLHPDDTQRMGRREAIRLLDELLASARAGTDDKARQAVTKTLPQLMRSLRAGLQQTGMKAPQVNELLHGLRDVHGPLVFGRGDADRIRWRSVDKAWLDATFPATVPRQAPVAAAPVADLAGSWVEFAQAGPHGLRRYRVVHADQDEDLVGLANELHVLFDSLPLAQLARQIRSGEARLFRVDDRALRDFAEGLQG